MDKKFNFSKDYTSDYQLKNRYKILCAKIKLFLKILSYFLKTGLKKSESKSVDVVKADYNKIWEDKTYFPKSSDPKIKQLLFYDGRYFEKDMWAEKRVFFEVIQKQISKSNFKKILEVGCGNGILINSFARTFPHIEFYGIDLTKSGIEVSNSLKNNLNYTSRIGNTFLKNYHENDIKNLYLENISIKNIQEDKKYDFCFSTLALEQMKAVQSEAIDKITKITKDTIVLIEPFRFVNKSLLSSMYCKIKDYFDLNLENIEINGFKMVEFYIVPSKFYRQVSVLVLKKQ
jgi:SAM-dependent methyltransferase